MGKRRCRLCDKFAVDASIFCENHRHSAQLFAHAFGGDLPSAAGTAAPVPEPSAAPPGGTLSQIVHGAFERILASAKTRPDARRWPQISIYYVDDKLMARPYYSIVPGAGENGIAPLAVDSDEIRRAVAPGSAVMRELAARYEERAVQLQQRALLSLDLHLLTYARLIGINENVASRGEKNLATFDLEAGGPKRTDIAAVRARLRHERW